MKRDLELEANIVAKYAAIESVLDERGRRLWAAAESVSIGYGGAAVVSDATGISLPTIRSGRRELASGDYERERVRRPGGGRRRLGESQPGLKEALERLVDPVSRGDSNAGCPGSPTSRGSHTHEVFPASREQ